MRKRLLVPGNKSGQKMLFQYSKQRTCLKSKYWKFKILLQSSVSTRNTIKSYQNLLQSLMLKFSISSQILGIYKNYQQVCRAKFKSLGLRKTICCLKETKTLKIQNKKSKSSKIKIKILKFFKGRLRSSKKDVILCNINSNKKTRSIIQTLILKSVKTI